MGDFEYAGTLDIDNGAIKVRIYSPSVRKLEWFTDLNEMKEKGYSLLKNNATKTWAIYGKDLNVVRGVIRGQLEVSLADIPGEAQIAVVSGKYSTPTSGLESLSDGGLGNVIVTSTFMRKYDGREINVPSKPSPQPQKVIPYSEQSIPTKIATPRIAHPQVPAKPSVPTVVIPKVVPKPIDPKAEHYANQASMKFWERTGAAATNRPSNK